MDKKEIKEMEKQESLNERYNELSRIHEVMKKIGVPQASTDNYLVNDMQASYQKIGFSKADAVSLFVDHKYMTRKLVAEKYALELFFGKEDKRKPINMAQRIYQDVLRKHEEYAEYISKAEVDEIAELVASRSAINDGEYLTMPSIASKNVRVVVAQPVQDIVKKLQKNADKIINIVDMHLDTAYKNKGDVKNLDPKKFVEMYKMLNDIKRLEKGEATSHVAVLVKEKELNNKSVDELMDIINEQRDYNRE